MIYLYWDLSRILPGCTTAGCSAAGAAWVVTLEFDAKEDADTGVEPTDFISAGKQTRFKSSTKESETG